MTPVVSVIIPHHLNENQAYLDLCLKAVNKSEGVSFEVIVVADTVEPPKVPTGVRMYHRPDLTTASAKVNWATTQAHPESKYFLIMSDDVVISKYALSELVYANGGLNIILNPMSNSEIGSRFYADLGPFKPDMSMEDIQGMEDVLISWQRERTFLIHQSYVCFYCTLIPRNVWKVVGPLDERLDARHNDQDYCMRAAQKNIPSMIDLGAFAFHFGSKTIYKAYTSEQMNECSRVFQEKWNAAGT